MPTTTTYRCNECQDPHPCTITCDCSTTPLYCVDDGADDACWQPVSESTEGGPNDNH